MQSQTKLNLVDKDGDLQISGDIKNYNITPVNIQAGSETAAQNGKMTVSMTPIIKNDFMGLLNHLLALC